MKHRWEIKDSHYPKERGMRFTSLARACNELSHAVPYSRFYIYDRLKKQPVSFNDEPEYS